MDNSTALTESQLRAHVSDVIKEFKASGDFDRLRKDYFNEITSQDSFQSLTKNIEEYVQRILDEQHRQTNNLKKNDIRETIRRKLIENYSFNNQISVLINQTIDSKIDNSLKSILGSMVNKLVKNTSNESNANETKAADSTNECSNKTAGEQQQPQQSATTSPKPSSIQRKISIEDILHPELHKAKEAPGAASKLEKPKTSTTTQGLKPADKKEQPDAKKLEPTSKKVMDEKKKVKATSTDATSKQPPVKSTPTTATQHEPKFLSASHLKFLNDSKLEKTDSSNEYHFDWNLNEPLDSEIDNISVSNLSLSDGEDVK